MRHLRYLHIESKLVLNATGILPKLKLPSEVQQSIDQLAVKLYPLLLIVSRALPKCWTWRKPWTGIFLVPQSLMILTLVIFCIAYFSKILLIGYSHSSAVVCQELHTMLAKLNKVYIYNRKGFGYATRRPDGSIENDNSGLKQSAAHFTQMSLQSAALKLSF